MLRLLLTDFALNNPLYAEATVAVYQVDDQLEATSTLATLYAAPAGSTTLPNPQVLDSRGKYPQPVYVDTPVVVTASGVGSANGTTGVSGLIPRWRGEWTTATLYYAGERLQGPGETTSYVVLTSHTSAVFSTDLAAGELELETSFTVQATGSGTVPRSVTSKLRDEVSVRDFDAAGDGVTDDAAAVAAMVSEVGFVRFTRGAYLLSTTTIDAPVYFDPGAYITVASGDTLTLTERITSPRQWIFRGDGNYLINVASDSGEDAREVHASWFGAFPTNTTATDNAPYIQKAFDALDGQVREGVVQFDVGSYHVESAMTVPRGVEVAGMGTRRTVFDVSGSGYDVFTSGGAACKWTNIMFEQPSGEVAYRTGALINMQHDSCEADNVWLWNSQYGIVMAGANCSVRNANATYGVAMSAGSAMIKVTGNGSSIDNVNQKTSSFGPTAIVEIGTGAASSFGFGRVTNVQVVCPSIPVLINADTSTVSRITIDNIVYAGLSGTSVPAVVKLITAGTAGISGVTLSNLQGNALATELVTIVQASSGITEDITLDNAIIAGATGNGISLTRSAGTLRGVRIGDTVQLASRATPIAYSGTVSDIRVSPMATPNANHAYCYTQTVADDGVLAIDLHRSVFTGVGLLSVGDAEHGIFRVRAASSPAVTAMTTLTPNVATTTGALTGTTGTDGKATVSAAAGFIYVENRLGSSQAVHFTLLTGL